MDKLVLITRQLHKLLFSDTVIYKKRLLFNMSLGKNGLYIHRHLLTYGYLMSPMKMRGQNICLKCYQSLELLLYFGKGFRFFHKGNIGSVGQRASKLLAVEV